jgi:hypothetical protein
LELFSSVFSKEDDATLSPASPSGPDYQHTPSPSSGTSLSSASSSKLGPSSRGRKRKMDPVEQAILESMNKFHASNVSHQESDDDAHFGRQVTSTLRRFSNQQKALAKVRIQQVLMEVEFDSSPSPYSMSNYQY